MAAACGSDPSRTPSESRASPALERSPAFSRHEAASKKKLRDFPDKVSPGTVSISSSITDERPDVSELYDYKNYEEYQAWVEAVEAREELSPSERQDIINGAPVPDETYEEGLERNADD
uniref:hypothetical protein n=1 Tax=Paenarthrobacter ureafaciens TaxID=37931 RepID=UPI003F490D0C